MVSRSRKRSSSFGQGSTTLGTSMRPIPRPRTGSSRLAKAGPTLASRAGPSCPPRSWYPHRGRSRAAKTLDRRAGPRGSSSDAREPVTRAPPVGFDRVDVENVPLDAVGNRVRESMQAKALYSKLGGYSGSGSQEAPRGLARPARRIRRQALARTPRSTRRCVRTRPRPLGESLLSRPQLSQPSLHPGLDVGPILKLNLATPKPARIPVHLRRRD